MKFFFKRILPTPETLEKNRFLFPIVKRIGHAKIWQINRRTIASGFAIGLFFGCLPIPIQMPCALLLACFLRVNAPVAVFSTLISNPLTIPVVFYFNYRVGQWLFGGGVVHVIQFKYADLMTMGGQVLMPLFTGSVVVGTGLAIVGYIGVYISWEWYLHKQLQSRLSWKTTLKIRRKKRLRHKKY